MKLLKKVVVTTGISLLLSTSSLLASSVYFVQKGDTLLEIVYKLGFSSIEESGITVQSGDVNKIYVGEELMYNAKKKKRTRFKLKKRIDLDKFCFKDNSSIHYRAEERCSNKEKSVKKQLVRKKRKKH